VNKKSPQGERNLGAWTGLEEANDYLKVKCQEISRLDLGSERQIIARLNLTSVNKEE